jgi:hypothetical protein
MLRNQITAEKSGKNFYELYTSRGEEPEPPSLSSNPNSWTARAAARSSGLGHFRLVLAPKKRGASMGGHLIVARRSCANWNCQEKHGGSRKAEKWSR